ncbi:MAG: hypothetical protein AB2669_19510, partial [Candidatus Thiodiazotropha endolucinida]
EELVPGEGGASTGRFKWLTRKKESEPGQKKPGGSPLYKAVRKHLYEAGLSAPVVPASRRYLDAVAAANASAKKRPNDPLKEKTFFLLETLHHYSLLGDSLKGELQGENKGYSREYFLENARLEGEEYDILVNEAIYAQKVTEEQGRNYSESSQSQIRAAKSESDVRVAIPDVPTRGFSGKLFKSAKKSSSKGDL